MIRKADKMIGTRVQAKNGEIGKIHDLYFSDDSWAIRYLIVDTGPWLFGRRVLMAPSAVQENSFADGALQLALTTEQVENSPEIDLDMPVSRQAETALHHHYAWDYYWMAVPAVAYGPAGIAGGPTGVGTPIPVAAVPPEDTLPPESTEQDRGDPHLRSMNEVVGYHIEANDGEIGHVEDFFVDDRAWCIRYMLVDTRNWLPGRHVLVSPEWVERFSWNESMALVDVTREQVEESPEYRPASDGLLDRDYEARLFRHYGTPHYWF